MDKGKIKEAEIVLKKIRKIFCADKMNKQGIIWYHCTQLKILEQKPTFLEGLLNYSYFITIQTCFLVAGFLINKKSFLSYVLFTGCLLIGAFLIAPIMYRAKRYTQFEEYIKNLNRPSGEKQ